MLRVQPAEQGTAAGDSTAAQDEVIVMQATRRAWCKQLQEKGLLTSRRQTALRRLWLAAWREPDRASRGSNVRFKNCPQERDDDGFSCVGEPHDNSPTIHGIRLTTDDALFLQAIDGSYGRAGLLAGRDHDLLHVRDTTFDRVDV